MFQFDMRQVDVVLTSANGTGGLRLDSWPRLIGHIVANRYGASSKLCCPGAKQQRWAPPLVTRFGVISRLQ